jgi:hypothetical protein
MTGRSWRGAGCCAHQVTGHGSSSSSSSSGSSNSEAAYFNNYIRMGCNAMQAMLTYLAHTCAASNIFISKAPASLNVRSRCTTLSHAH